MKRDLCFCAKTRFFTVDKPVGWPWGDAELALTDYIIVRTEDPAILAELPALRNRSRRLATPLNHSGKGNIFLGAALEDTPEKEWITPPAYTNLRTGKIHLSEEDMWSGAQDGDSVFFSKSPKNPDVPGVGLLIKSVAARTYFFERGTTLEKVDAWKSLPFIKTAAMPTVIVED